MHSLEWFVVILPLTEPELWHKEGQDFTLFPLQYFKPTAQNNANVAQGCVRAHPTLGDSAQCMFALQLPVIPLQCY